MQLGNFASMCLTRFYQGLDSYCWADKLCKPSGDRQKDGLSGCTWKIQVFILFQEYQSDQILCWVIWYIKI